MTTQASTYLEVSQAFMPRAELALAKSDLRTASRKGWYAAAHMLRGVARARGWRYSGFRGFDEVVDRLVADYGDNSYWGEFASAEALDMNSFDPRMSSLTVEFHLSLVRQLLTKLESLPA